MPTTPTVDSVEDLHGGGPGTPGQQLVLSSYKNGGTTGGGTFVWEATRSKGDHDGGVIVDPDMAFEAALAPNSGTGVWVRQIGAQAIKVEWFGAVANDSTDDLWAIDRALYCLL